MAIDRAGTLIDLLREHHLLETGQLEELGRTPDVADTDPQVLGQCLIELGWLTPFQVDRLIQNRPKDVILGSYHLLDRIGQGETGPVFQARKPGKATTVALKIIPKPRLADPQLLARFQQEVRIAAQLQHPNLAPVSAVGQHGNLFLFAREFVPGADLSRMVRELGPLPSVLACNAVRQAALALQCAHDKGLSHRRVKASNLIVVDQPGTEAVVKLVDFGLGQLQAGATAGLDAAGDLAALGQTLSFLLTGQTAPPAAGAFPGDLEEVLRRFAPGAEDRFGSAGEAASALEPLCHESPPVTEPISSNGVAGEPGELPSATAAPVAVVTPTYEPMPRVEPAASAVAVAEALPLEGVAVPVMGTVGVMSELAEPAVAPPVAEYESEPAISAVGVSSTIAPPEPEPSPEPVKETPTIEAPAIELFNAVEKPAEVEWPAAEKPEVSELAPVVPEPTPAPAIEVPPPPPPMEAFAPNPFGGNPEPYTPPAEPEPATGGYFMDQQAAAGVATEEAGAFPTTGGAEEPYRRAPAKKKWTRGTILWIIVGALLHLVAAVILVVAIMALMNRQNPPPKNNRPARPKAKSQARLTVPLTKPAAFLMNI